MVGMELFEASRIAGGGTSLVVTLEPEFVDSSPTKEAGDDSELLELWNAAALKFADNFRRRPILTVLSLITMFCLMYSLNESAGRKEVDKGD